MVTINKHPGITHIAITPFFAIIFSNSWRFMELFSIVSEVVTKIALLNLNLIQNKVINEISQVKNIVFSSS